MGALFGVLDTAVTLSRQGVDVNFVDSNGWTALRWAALHDRLEVMELLIGAGIDVDLEDGQGNTTLMWALNERKPIREPPITRILSPSGDMQMHIGNTYNLRTSIAYPNWILPWPVRCSDDVLRLLIFHAKDIDAANFCQRTPLIQAADNRQFQYVAAFLSRGANIDRFDPQGLNALLCALQSSDERYDVPGMTLEGTATVHIGDHIIVDPAEGGAKPELSIESDITMTITRLISLDNIEAKDQHGRSALALAAAGGQDSIVEVLLRLGADVDSLDSNGMTPLLWACRRPVSRELHVGPLVVRDNAKVSQGLSIEFRGGKAAVTHCPEALEPPYDKRARIVASILSQSTPKVWINGSGETAMLLAADAGRGDIVSILQSKGLDRMAESDVPITPYSASTYYSDESGVSHQGTEQIFGLPAAGFSPRSDWLKVHRYRHPLSQCYGPLEIKDPGVWAHLGDAILDDDESRPMDKSLLPRELHSAALFTGPGVLMDNARLICGNVFASKKYALHAMWTHPRLGGSQSQS